MAERFRLDNIPASSVVILWNPNEIKRKYYTFLKFVDDKETNEYYTLGSSYVKELDNGSYKIDCPTTAIVGKFRFENNKLVVEKATLLDIKDALDKQNEILAKYNKSLDDYIDALDSFTSDTGLDFSGYY